MINVRVVKSSELETAKTLIRTIFPDAIVQITDSDILLIAEHEDKPVGFIHIIEEEDRILLQGIGVDKSMRGHGVGTVLMENALELLKYTHKPVYLKVKAMNPVISLYARYGFFLKKFGHTHVLVKKSNA